MKFDTEDKSRRKVGAIKEDRLKFSFQVQKKLLFFLVCQRKIVTHLYCMPAMSSSLLEATISGILWYLSER